MYNLGLCENGNLTGDLGDFGDLTGVPSSSNFGGLSTKLDTFIK
jgi:hypothetical protein